MLLTGIWTVEIASMYGWENRGILIFCADKKHVMGGGRNHYSVGSYKKSGKNIKIKLDVNYHSREEVIFGAKRKRISVAIEGKWKDDEISGSVNNPNNSKQSIPLRLTRRTDLP